MKMWRCDNCTRTKSTEDNIVVVTCVCGDYMKEYKDE